MTSKAVVGGALNKVNEVMETGWIFVANKNCMVRQKLGVAVCCSLLNISYMPESIVKRKSLVFVCKSHEFHQTLEICVKLKTSKYRKYFVERINFW